MFYSRILYKEQFMSKTFLLKEMCWTRVLYSRCLVTGHL